MDNIDRPSPDELLELARDENNSARGSLRVYLGMCPGVGKTYAMLEDARRRDKEHRDLLVGLVETHGRAETEALLKNLPTLPRKTVDHRGVTLSEFDLDEALRRKPSILVLDELAHTNAPGSRHPKRWQDVKELLGAGIHVWTTLNIQHVESLRDTVASITGVRVQETVPDSFLDAAEEVRVIDLTIEHLLQRLAEGKVYLGARAGAATEGFFREGNLRALREMALRFTARKVDAQKRDFMRRNRIPGPWRAVERFLVAVGPSPHAERLIRITCRLAQAQEADWLAVHIETGQTLDETQRRGLAANLTLARSLGGETVSFPSDDPVRGLLHVARRENVTQIVAGKAIGDAWWKTVFRRSIADRLERESGPIDLLLVHPGLETTPPHRNPIPSGKSRFLPRELFLAGSVWLIATALGLLLEPWIGYQSVALLYLLGVAIAGLLISRPTVLVLAVAGSLTWNFFFTEPRMTFVMLNPRDIVLLASTFIVAAVIGHLTTRLRRREEASRAGEERSRALYRLTRVAAASPSLEHSIAAALKQVESLFVCDAALLAQNDNGEFDRLGGTAISSKEESVCRWALDRQQIAGRFTDTLPESTILAMPLLVNGKPDGVLAVRPRDAQLESPVIRDLLEAFGAHFSVMLEKEELVRSQREAALSEKSRHFQRALLDHVSHEIKTPVALIQGLADQLMQKPADPALLASLRDSAARLNRVLTQLVTLTRAEAGLIQPTWELCDAHDLAMDVVDRFPHHNIQILGETFTFQTDPMIFDTILSNLVQNAVQHGDGDIAIRAEQNDSGVRVIVTNHGPVIPQPEQARIFDRFQRGAETPAGGMGLGLAIAREFAALLGGRVQLDRSEPAATEFSFHLPHRP